MKWKNNVSVHVFARQDVDSMQVQGGVLGEIKVASEFVGYGTVATESNVVALVKKWRIHRQLTSW